jgi:hypothetical protein
VGGGPGVRIGKRPSPSTIWLISKIDEEGPQFEEVVRVKGD